MSVKVAILKKVHKDIRRSQTKMINSVTREIMTQPFKERVKLAIMIIFKGKAEVK